MRKQGFPSDACTVIHYKEVENVLYCGGFKRRQHNNVMEKF